MECVNCGKEFDPFKRKDEVNYSTCSKKCDNKFRKKHQNLEVLDKEDVWHIIELINGELEDLEESLQDEEQKELWEVYRFSEKEYKLLLDKLSPNWQTADTCAGVELNEFSIVKK